LIVYSKINKKFAGFYLTFFQIYDIIILESEGKMKKDCFNCSNSFVDDEGNLHCVKQNGKIVEENETCEEWN
jgi:hypothetical protein